MAKYDGTVLVVGATGGVGGFVIQVLRREAISTRVLLRDQAKGRVLEEKGIQLVIGDLQSISMTQLVKAMEGVSAVISAIGSRSPFSFTAGLNEVDRDGNMRLINAAKKAGVNRYILCSTMGVYPKRNILKPFSILFYPKWEAEQFLVKSGLTYTIIRPGGLVSSEVDLGGRNKAAVKRDPVTAKGQLNGEGGFNGNIGRVHRADVAEAMVQSLWTPAANKAIFEILNRSGVKPENRKSIVGVFGGEKT